MLKKVGKYLLKKITNISIKKSIKYGILSIFWFYGFALLGILGIEGIAVVGGLTYFGVLDYGIDKIIK
jgi:hypothetical protein